MLNSTNIKTWISDLRAVSGAVRAADMSVAAIGAVDYAKALDGLSLKQAQLMLTTQGIVGEEQKDLLVKQGLIATSDRMSASLVSEALANNGLNKEKVEEILIDAGLMSQNTKELISENAVTEAKLRAILAEKGIKGAKADTLIASILQTGQNGKEALSWKVLGTAAKEAMVAMLHNPLTWIVVAIASIGLLVKGYDALIGKQEKLSRQKIEGLDEDISRLDEEIKSLEELQSKLEDAKGSRYELSQIQTELNDVIGETQGLLNGESKAWDVANAKLKANIELKKQQRKQAQQDKVNESKVLYDNNTIEIDWHTDTSGEKAREYAKALGVMETYTDGKTDWESYLKFIESDDYKNLPQKVKTALGDAMTFKTTYDTEWAEYLKEQAETALNVFDETISNYDGAGGQEFIKGLISDMAQDGASLSEISDVVTQVIENQDMQDAINKYWESLVNPDINSEEALQAVKKIFDDIAAKNPALKDFFDNFYNGIVAGGKAATDTSSDVNKMTDSLDSLSSAIKAAESAFELFNEVEKDFNSTGAISAENIQKILNKFPELEDELYEYIMSMRTGASIMDLLKTKSDDMATMSIKAFKRMYLSSNSVSQDIKDDYESAFKLIGLEWDNTQSVMANVNTQIVDANGQATQTFVEQWTEACKLAGANVSTFAQGISALLGGDFYDGTSGVYRVQGKGIYYKDGSGMDGKGTNLVNVKAMELLESGQFTSSSDAYKAAYNILSNQMDKSWENQAEFERRQKEFEERMKQYAVTSDDKSGSKKNEPLDNYLKYAENRYKIHQDETQYINDLEWALDNLVKTEDELLDVTGKIDEAYRDLAENRIGDLEHEIEMLQNAKGEAVNVVDKYKEIQRIAYEEAERYRARLRGMGYDDETIEKTKEIQELQKTWWDAQKSIADWSYSNSERWIDERNTYNDWELYGDNEIAAWERVLKRFKTEFPNELEKIKDIEQKIYEARKDAMEKSISDIEDYIDARNTFNDWEAYGDSELKAVQRITKEIEKAYKDRLLSYEEYIDKLEEQHQRLYTLAQDEVDKHLSNIDKYIDARNHYNDWDEFGDSEIEAIKRQCAILDEAYRLNLISLEEYTEKSSEYTQKLYSVAKDNIIETVSELVEDYEEMKQFESSQLESQKTLLQSYYNVTNAIAEAQHEINKELEASMTMHEYLNEETRELLFNQEDYNALNKELLDIQSAANALQEQYNNDILNASEETIAEITSQYQMQYETMMKQYEIAKAELDVAKKRQKLDNVLAERNTRMFINGQWQWVAKTQDVINAQNELAEAEIERKKQEASLEQTEAINEFTEQINALETDLKKIRKYWSDMQEMLNGESEEVAEALRQISEVSSPELQRVIEATGGSVESFSLSLSESTETMSTIITDNLGDMSTGINDIVTDLEKYSDAIKALVDKIKNISIDSEDDKDDDGKRSTSDIIAEMKANSAAWHTASESEKKALEDRNQYLGGLIGAKYDSATGTWTYPTTSSSSSSGGSSSSSSGKVVQAGSDGNAPAGTKVGDTVNTAGGSYLVVPHGTPGSTYNPASGLSSIKIKEKNADGTRYTSGGLTLMGEEGFEAFITNNGRLIPINQPTIGNIGAGGIVFNREQMSNLRNLWDLSNLGKVSPFVSSSNATTQSTVIDNSIHINGLTVGEQGNEDWINGLRRYVITHK